MSAGKWDGKNIWGPDHSDVKPIMAVTNEDSLNQPLRWSELGWDVVDAWELIAKELIK